MLKNRILRLIDPGEITVSKLRDKLKLTLYDNQKKLEKIDRIKKDGFVEEEITIPWYMIVPTSYKKLVWNLIIDMTAFYTLFFLPIDFGFTKGCLMGPQLANIFSSFDIVFSVLYFLDLVFKFFTPFYNNKGYLVLSMKEIAFTNIKSNLLMGLLAIIPWNQLAADNPNCGFQQKFITQSVVLMNLVRATKIIEFNTLVEKSSSRHLNLFRLAKLLISFFYVCHFFGCITVGTTSIISGITNQFDGTYSFSSIANIYTFCLIRGINLLLSTDLNMTNPTEKIIVIVFNIMSLAITANIFGYVALIIDRLNSRKISNSKKLTEKLDLVNEYLVYENVRESLRSEACSYYKFMFIRQRMLFEDDIYKDINPMLLSSVKLELWKEAYFKIDKFFSSDFVSPFFFSKCLELMQGRMFKKDDIILEEGENSYDFYLICSKSSVDIYCGGLLINTLEEGKHFGEVALFTTSKKRTATVVSKRDGDFLCITGTDFYKLILDFETERNYFRLIAERSLKDYANMISPQQFGSLITKKGKIYTSLLQKNLYVNPPTQKNRLIYQRCFNEEENTLKDKLMQKNKYLIKPRESLEELKEP